jgi:hypothetical protein
VALPIAVGRNDFAPGVLPGVDVADGAGMEAIALVGSDGDGGDSVDESLDARGFYLIMQNSHGEKCQLVHRVFGLGEV